jgi:ComF family protein
MRSISSVRTLAGVAYELFASLLAPPRCAACDAAVVRAAAFCSPCAAQVEPAGTQDPTRLAAFVYGGPIAETIVRLKYGARPDLARPLGDLLYRAAMPHVDVLRGALVVPVPLHPSRLAERGYNQSALVGGRLARHMGAPFDAMALARVRDTTQQAKLDRAARLANVDGSIRVRHAGRVQGRTVLLVDDVSTTGATLAACADALLGAGADEVRTAVVARAERAHVPA